MTGLELAAPSAELEGAVAEFRRIFAEFGAQAGAIDQERIHPFRLIRALADAGFGRLRVPVEHGGFGVTLPELFELLAQAGRADSNIPQILRGHFTTVECSSLFADYIRVAALDAQDSAVFAIVPVRHEGVDHVDDWDGIGQPCIWRTSPESDATSSRTRSSWSVRAGARACTRCPSRHPATRRCRWRSSRRC